METTKMTTQFAEIFKAMPTSEKTVIQRRCLEIEQPIQPATIRFWAYQNGQPLSDIKAKIVADILRGMGYDVDPETLFKKYPKPVNDAQQEK